MNVKRCAADQVDRELASGEYFMKENEKRQRKRQIKLVRTARLLLVHESAISDSVCLSVCLSVTQHSPSR